MTTGQSKYAQTGVDVHKAGIEVFKSTVENLFPDAFCVVYQHPTRPGYGMVLHTDGAGSKPVQCYLHFRETGDLSAFSGLPQDVFEMNYEDILCVNGTPTGFVDYVAINKRTVPKKEFLSALNEGFKEHFYALMSQGISVPFAGGETADLPRQCRTVDVAGTISAEVKLDDVIDGSNVKPMDIIIGLRSGGQTKYESKRNSGIQCNGISLASCCLMLPDYMEKYPEIRDTEGWELVNKGKEKKEPEYYGKYRTDQFLADLGMTVGEAIISPTRSYAPLIVRLIKERRKDVHGMALNSGGGQTKVLRIGRNVHYVKNNLPEPDPIFYLIQQESGEEWKPMHENFNMGIGFDIVVPPDMEFYIIDAAKELGIKAQRTGFVIESKDTSKRENGNMLTIQSRFGEFRYP